ncbi:DUF5959 family protein [Streptomyces collinus]|uniref:DUF5959 family protein n=1 Tax=Streptomyces collinus TaxID=42684 RepID=UPI0033C45FE5
MEPVVLQLPRTVPRSPRFPAAEKREPSRRPPCPHPATPGSCLAGSCTPGPEVRTPFARGALKTWIFPDDLRQWQQALDSLDAGLAQDGRRLNPSATKANRRLGFAVPAQPTA